MANGRAPVANGGREDVGFDTRVFDRREPKGLTGGCADVVVEWCSEAMMMMMMMMTTTPYTNII